MYTAIFKEVIFLNLLDIIFVNNTTVSSLLLKLLFLSEKIYLCAPVHNLISN